MITKIDCDLNRAFDTIANSEIHNLIWRTIRPEARDRSVQILSGICDSAKSTK